MKVVGFTIIRNAIKLDYPVVESLESLLPLCDEVIVSVGKSDDDTLNLIKSIPSPKIRVMESVWDDSLRKGGVLLAIETNKVLGAIPGDADWLVYLQADEILHEKDIPSIKEAMEKWKDDKNVEGLLFSYNHFYGSYDYIGAPYRWYRHDIRIIRNDKHIRSFRDAQGFRKFTKPPTNQELLNGGEKLKVKPANVTVYHYGWVKHPEYQQNKQKSYHKMWHEDEWLEKNVGEANEYNYTTRDPLVKFKGTHPALMQARIKRKDWDFVYDEKKKKLKLKEWIYRFCLETFGWKPGEYKNYKLI
ncbi:MAG: glycosyltransferase family 2 protein [Bacteroidia bacterium]